MNNCFITVDAIDNHEEGITLKSSTGTRQPMIRPLTLAVMTVLGSALGANPTIAIAEDTLSEFDIADVLVEELVQDVRANGLDARDVAIDPEGNRYVIGRFKGIVDFGELPNIQRLQGGAGSIFVARYDANDELVWVRQFDSQAVAGLPATFPAGIEFDDSGNSDNVTIAGSFTGRLTLGTNVLQGDINADGFVAQLDAATGDVRWANQIDSNRVVEVADLDTSGSGSLAGGSLAVTGNFKGIAEFQGKFGSSESRLTLSPGGRDMYTVVYAPNGTIDYVVQAGGEDADGSSVALSGSRLTIGGDFVGTMQLPDRSSKPVQTITSNGKSDGFVANYIDGRLRFVHGIGGTESDSVRQVTTKSIDIYAAGNFRDTVTIGSEQFTSRGNSDGFVTQISQFGDNEILATAQIGGSESDFVHSLDADEINRPSGRMFVGGEFRSSDLTINQNAATLGIENPNSAGVDSAYVVGFDTEVGSMTPTFATAVSGDFFSRNLTTDEEGSQVLWPGRFDDAITFGSGDGRIELDEPNGGTAMAVARFAAVGKPAAQLQFSTNRRATIDGVEFRPEDVMAFNPDTNAFERIVDGSDVGLSRVNIDAVHTRADGSMLFSVDGTVDLPGLPGIKDQDVVRFIPTQLGDDTQGSFELFLRGSDVALEAVGEGIDAITSDASGRLVISTKSTARVQGINGRLTARDEDLLALVGNKWELVFDGSAIGLGSSSEDVKAARLVGDRVQFATLGDYEFGGLTGAGDDVLDCQLSGVNGNQVSDCRVVFDGSERGLEAARIDGFSVGL